jgi:hypothetical protein
MFSNPTIVPDPAEAGIPKLDLRGGKVVQIESPARRGIFGLPNVGPRHKTRKIRTPLNVFNAKRPFSTQ